MACLYCGTLTKDVKVSSHATRKLSAGHLQKQSGLAFLFPAGFFPPKVLVSVLSRGRRVWLARVWVCSDDAVPSILFKTIPGDNTSRGAITITTSHTVFSTRLLLNRETPCPPPPVELFPPGSPLLSEIVSNRGGGPQITWLPNVSFPQMPVVPLLPSPMCRPLVKGVKRNQFYLKRGDISVATPEERRLLGLLAPVASAGSSFPPDEICRLKSGQFYLFGESAAVPLTLINPLLYDV